MEKETKEFLEKPTSVLNNNNNTVNNNNNSNNNLTNNNHMSITETSTTTTTTTSSDKRNKNQNRQKYIKKSNSSSGNNSVNNNNNNNYQFDPQTNEIFVYSPKENLLPQSPKESSVTTTSSTSSSTAKPKIIDTKDTLNWQQKQILNNNSKLNPNSTPFIPVTVKTLDNIDNNNNNNNNNNSSTTSKPNSRNRKRFDKKPPPDKQQQQQDIINIQQSPVQQKPQVQQQNNNRKPNQLNNKPNINNTNTNNNNIVNNLNNKRNERRRNEKKQQQQQQGTGNIRKSNEKINIIYKEDQLKTLEFTPLAVQMIDKIQNNNYECMICYDIIGKKQQVINCISCFTMFHIDCINQWANKSQPSASNGGRPVGGLTAGQQIQKNDGKWKCPGCRHVHENKSSFRATCYCGKVTDPQYNPYFLPHSCGEVCGKAKGVKDSQCPHKCNMQCHPGACLPCISLGDIKKCYCKKTEYRILCGEVDKGKACDSPCEKSLNCHKHKCADRCHTGACKPCAVLETQKCYCGKSIEPRLCGTGDLDTQSNDQEDDPRYYSCREKCQRPLNCGNHKCQKTCHKGPCEPCLMTPDRITRCACSQSTLVELGLKRESCLEEIPVCQKKCMKLLACGEHYCQEKCHTGDCSLCKIKIKTNCRCGKQTENRQCGIVHQNLENNGSAFLCNNVCRTLRSCKKHECGIKCCPSALHPEDPSGAHVCTLVCGRPAKCGVHKCQQLCHQNKCFGCYVNSYEDLTCSCGKTVILPPVPCGTKPPLCSYPCTKERECGHKDSEIIQHTCHSGVCPPCVVLVDKLCSGGHEMRKNIKCCTTEVSCGRVCGKILSCLKHTCPKTCHSGPCIDPSQLQAQKDKQELNQNSCGYPCGISLSTCTHGCGIICHPDEPCPTGQICKQKIKIYCPCQRRSVESTCLGNDIVRQLECDEVCEREEREKKLKEAFGIGNGTGENSPTTTTTTTSTTPGGIISPNQNAVDISNTLIDDNEIQYENLQSFCKASPKSIKKLEGILDDYLNTNNLKLTLKYTDSIQHYFIIQVLKLYQFRIRDRPLQNLIEVFRKSSSAMPSPKLSDSIQTSTLTSPVIGGSQSYASISINSPVFETQLIANPTLLFQNLNEFIKSEHIQNVLQEFEGKYKLIWVDNFNCLVVFNDQFNFNQATQLKSIPFDNEVYQDDSTLFDSIIPSFNTSNYLSNNNNNNQKKDLPNDFYKASQQMNTFSFLDDQVLQQQTTKQPKTKKKQTTTTTTTISATNINDSFDNELGNLKNNNINVDSIGNWEEN